jgi:hypothetical protein
MTHEFGAEGLLREFFENEGGVVGIRGGRGC